ncbi:MAG: CBS domain-containing protein [Gammaproteobacteria bacterium]|nr:CBS domain-containing protein [Gammaproteobacteria bacterium]
MKCPGCGYENLPGADACENCGTSLTRDDVPQADTEVERSLMEDPVECLQPIRPLTVSLQTSLAGAIQMMRNHSIGCVLITDDGGKLTGILTERDLLQKVAGKSLDLAQCIVGDYMSPAPESSKPDHPLGYALHRMIVSDIRYLPIIDSSGRPAGIVSSRDIVAYMAKRFHAAGEP